MTLKEKLKELPKEQYTLSEGLVVDCIYIIITNRKHDSGYKIYESYAVSNDWSYAKRIGSHDVINFEPCKYQDKWRYPIAIDSIETGMFRLFTHYGKIRIKWNVSTLVLEPVKDEEVVKHD